MSSVPGALKIDWLAELPPGRANRLAPASSFESITATHITTEAYLAVGVTQSNCIFVLRSLYSIHLPSFLFKDIRFAILLQEHRENFIALGDDCLELPTRLDPTSLPGYG